MSFSVDQFMQVKCKFQLVSGPDSPDSIPTNSERVRLCTSVDFDTNSTLIVMICSNETTNNHIVAYYTEKPKVIVKQIYYHYYNEDIAAVCLSDTGNKLALISASSIIYILPIKSIILNLHTKESKSTQENIKCPYDASLLVCCTIENPIAIAYWECLETDNKSTVIVASESGELSFISVDEKKEVSKSNVNEKISYMDIVRDRFGHSVLITCSSLKQYRFALEIVESDDSGVETTQTFPLPQSNQISSDEYIYLEKDLMPPWNRRPIPIKLHSSNLSNMGSGATTNRRALLGRAGDQIGRLFNGITSRERNTPSIFYHPASSMFSVVDSIGLGQKSPSTISHKQMEEQRFLRFFSTKQFYYRPQKPILVCKLTSLDPDELITHVVLTDRFLAIATDRDRCLVNSKNCCNLKNSDTLLELDPLVKEVTFSNDETILLLLKSPVSNDKTNIIDSFLLVTNKSIYSIEARQSSRDMFINLIDTHLHLKELIGANKADRKHFESNPMVRSFLSHRDEVYERINYDSRAFSALFKLELNSLYESYGDRLLVRGQFELANKFFQMAKFGHTKTLVKYIRFAASQKTIFTEHQKRSVESVFIESLNACLDDNSTEDSCWLWFYYINFYLNYVANLSELEIDILKLLDSSSSDCYLAITFYKALSRDEAGSGSKSFKMNDVIGSPLETMEKIYNLSELFKNEFLMTLLDRTLNLVPQTANLDALSDCLGVDNLLDKTRIKCMVN